MLAGSPGVVADKFFCCIGATALGALLCLSASAKAELQANISKSQLRMSVVIDGSVAHRWPVSTARRTHAASSATVHPIGIERHWAVAPMQSHADADL
jgi:hypothetical protein